MEACGLNQSASDYGQVMESCEHGKEFLGSIKWRNFVTS
jgi:hypothetical protein